MSNRPGTPRAGRGAQTICKFDGDLLGGTWLDDDTIVFGSCASSGLRRVPATGGVPQAVTKVDAGAGRGRALL